MFQTVPLGAADLGLVLAIAGAGFLAGEGRRRVERRWEEEEMGIGGGAGASVGVGKEEEEGMLMRGWGARGEESAA